MATIAASSSTSSTVLPTLKSSSSSLTWAKNVKQHDGSNYTGQLDRFGNRAGMGTLRTSIYIFGSFDTGNIATLINWMEYHGAWRNDKPNGFGTAMRYRGDGNSTIVYKGEWVDGVPVNDP
jgi:hypothetical protein